MKDAKKPTPEQRAIAEIITGVMGTTPEELMQNPDRVRARLRTALGGVFGAMQSSDASEPDLEPARAFARRVRTVLQAHDIDAPEGIERLPDELLRLGKGAKDLDAKQLGDALHKLADFVSTPEGKPRDIDELAQWLEQNLGPMLEPPGEREKREAKAREEREAFRRKVRSEIAESLRAKGFKTPGSDS